MSEKPKVHCPVCGSERVEPAEKCTDCGQTWYVRLPKPAMPDSVRELCDATQDIIEQDCGDAIDCDFRKKKICSPLCDIYQLKNALSKVRADYEEGV